MLDNLCHIFKLAAYMGLIESFGIILLAYQHNGYIVIYYALSLFFWTPSFIVISMTKSRSLNVYYPHAGLLNKANLGLSIGNNEASLASSFSTSK